MVCGDALTFLREQRAGAFDALVTDPPYSSGGFTRGDRADAPSKKYVTTGSALKAAPDFAGDTRDQRGFVAWSSIWMGDAHRALVEGAPACIFTDWRQAPATSDAFQVAGFNWRGLAVWGKGNRSRPMLGRFRSDAEFVVWGSRGYMPMRRGVGVLPGLFVAAPVGSKARRHITEKPVSVMEHVVAICRPDGMVLDPFAGSGSTGVACLQTGRRFVGVEQSPRYFEIACERLRAAEKALPAEQRKGAA